MVIGELIKYMLEMYVVYDEMVKEVEVVGKNIYDYLNDYFWYLKEEIKVFLILYLG